MSTNHSGVVPDCCRRPRRLFQERDAGETRSPQWICRTATPRAGIGNRTHTTTPARALRSRWRTPATLYPLISSPAVRAILGWDLPRRDVRLIEARPNTVCLEVGSGGGFYTAALRQHLGATSALIALDPSGAALAALETRLAPTGGASMHYLAGDACELPLGSNTVDTVFYGYSIEETHDPFAAIREAHRVLRPGGQLVLFLWRPAITRSRRNAVLGLTRQFFRLHASRTGFQNIRLVYRRPPGTDR